MKFSINCLLLGETPENSFSVDITDKIVVYNTCSTDNFLFDCNRILVSHFKSLVFNKISYKLKSLNINNHNYLDLWRINDTNVKNCIPKMTLKVILEVLL